MSTTWTLDDLEAIEKTIASGVLEVNYNGRKVTYQSAKDLRITRELIRRSLGLVNRGSRLLCESKKGTV